MVSTDELIKSELGKPAISEIDYSIKTYRGYVPVSQEMIDADWSIMSIVEDEVFNQGENTELSLVALPQKQLPKQMQLDLMVLKISNKKPSIYKQASFVTKSMFAALIDRWEG